MFFIIVTIEDMFISGYMFIILFLLVCYIAVDTDDIKSLSTVPNMASKCSNFSWQSAKHGQPVVYF